MRKLILFTAVAAALGTTATRAQAQEDYATATLTVGPLLFIDVDVSDLQFTPTATDFSAGSVGGVTNSVATKGNVPYTLTIEADDPAFTYTGSATPPAKPSTELHWSADGGTSFTPLANGTQDVATFSPGQYTTAMSYEIELQWDQDLEGTYELPITYTVVAFSVTPVVLAVEPSDTAVSSLVRVRNEGSRELSLRLYTRDFEQDSLGNHAFVSPGSLDNGCGDRVGYSPGAFSLPPGGEQPVSIRVDPDPVGETCWSVVFLESPPPAGDGVRVGARIGVKVFGLAGPPSRVARIPAAEVLEHEGRKVLRIDLRNDGAWPIQTGGSVEVLRFDGTRVGATEIGTASVLPKHRRRLDVPLPFSLDPGRYVAVSILDLGADQLVGAQVAFRVEGG
jgi:hypothetical protein